ncbi:hypothetical protein [Ruania halotolerans]|uniref:hypothetical protein n=1 Tax=Ruania halotolerans TaxID=2897773 RepID=UPI001E31685A|nr:hypothetical protein [Ruania halotolerans]UFU05004.1 hypothetical protein LQF10_10980 [Ruania halotolerans]
MSDDATTLPEVSGPFLQPARRWPAEPRWGHAAGLQVGLHPLPGPRGLLRIYTPYLNQPRERMMNFIAVEPIPAGQTSRGFSELEHSALDDSPGKRFWSSNDPADTSPREPAEPAQGVIETTDGVPHLRVYVQVEPFANGAEVSLRLTFRADQPHEVAIATFARESSVPLDQVITTATMGNYARLRLLRLADRIVTPGELWPDFPGADSSRHHFTPHARFGVDELVRTADGVLFAASPDEADPVNVTYADDVRPNWHFQGDRAVQYWRAADPDPAIQGLVNARASYWASESGIPGGPSYENVELVEPFRQGRELVFGIEPLTS